MPIYAFGGEVGMRATLRGDVDLVRAWEEVYHDSGVVSGDGPSTLGGTRQMTVGWPDDWDFDPFEDDEFWSARFTVIDGRVASDTSE